MRGEFLFLSVYLLTEFLNYLMAYIIIFQARMSRNLFKVALSVILIWILHSIVLWKGGYEPAISLSMITMLVIPLSLLERIEKKYLIIYPFVVTATSAFVISATFVVGLIMGMPEYLVLNDRWLPLFCQCVPSVILFGVFLYQKKKGYHSIQVQLGISQFILFNVASICIFILLSTMQVLSEGTITPKNMDILGVAISIASIAFIILILWQGIVVRRSIEVKERAKRYEQYMSLQEEYYYQIARRDEKMRRFKHDMNAHMAVLREYCKEGNNRELNDYLEQVINNSAVYDVKSYTGNPGVDAILRQSFEEAQTKEIHMEMKGVLPTNIDVSVFDLCTILSNLLKNAIEACEKVVEKENRKIIVEISSYNEQLILWAKNKIAEEVKISENRLNTSKPDAANHGIGSENVYATVKKYNGELEYSCEDGWFEVNIVL